MSNEDYHGDRSAVSSTQLKRMLISPAHFLSGITDPEESTEALLFGSVLHGRLLEPDTFESRFFAAMTRVVRNVFSTLDELIPWEKLKERMTQVLEVAADIAENPANFERVAKAVGTIVRNAVIDAIPGARTAVNTVAGSRRMAIDNLSENLLTSANLTGAAARGLDAAGNAVGLGPIGTEMLTALRKIERNTADFVAGAVAQ